MKNLKKLMITISALAFVMLWCSSCQQPGGSSGNNNGTESLVETAAKNDAQGLTVLSKEAVATYFTEENVEKYDVYAYRLSIVTRAVELDPIKWVKVTKEEAENYTLFVAVSKTGDNPIDNPIDNPGDNPGDDPVVDYETFTLSGSSEINIDKWYPDSYSVYLKTEDEKYKFTIYPKNQFWSLDEKDTDSNYHIYQGRIVSSTDGIKELFSENSTGSMKLTFKITSSDAKKANIEKEFTVNITKDSFTAKVPDFRENRKIVISSDETEIKYEEGKTVIVKLAFEGFDSTPEKVSSTLNGKTPTERNVTADSTIELGINIFSLGENTLTVTSEDGKVISDELKFTVRGVKVSFEVDGVKISEDSDITFKFKEGVDMSLFEEKEIKPTRPIGESISIFKDSSGKYVELSDPSVANQYSLDWWKNKETNERVDSTSIIKDDVVLVPLASKKYKITLMHPMNIHSTKVIGETLVKEYARIQQSVLDEWKTKALDIMAEGYNGPGDNTYKFKYFVVVGGDDDGKEFNTDYNIKSDLTVKPLIVHQALDLVNNNTYVIKYRGVIEGQAYKQYEVIEFIGDTKAKWYKVDPKTGEFAKPVEVAITGEVKDNKKYITLGDIKATVSGKLLTIDDKKYVVGEKPESPKKVIKISDVTDISDKYKNHFFDKDENYEFYFLGTQSAYISLPLSENSWKEEWFTKLTWDKEDPDIVYVGHQDGDQGERLYTGLEKVRIGDELEIYLTFKKNGKEEEVCLKLLQDWE